MARWPLTTPRKPGQPSPSRQVCLTGPNRLLSSRCVWLQSGSYGGNTPGNRLTAPFTEEHPHITVEWHHWNVEQVAETSATGVLQDVLHFPWAEGRLWQDYVARLVTQGMLLGLNRFIRRDHYDLTDYWPGWSAREYLAG